MIVSECLFFFFNDTATTEIYTLSLHDALPISFRSCLSRGFRRSGANTEGPPLCETRLRTCGVRPFGSRATTRSRRRSEEHTSELQSRQYLVCRLLLEKKKNYLSRNL